jgi:hypothetical protein
MLRWIDAKHEILEKSILQHSHHKYCQVTRREERFEGRKFITAQDLPKRESDRIHVAAIPLQESLDKSLHYSYFKPVRLGVF